MRVLADVRGVSAEVIRWQDGDNTKKDPFFILVLNNVALERPTGSNNFTEDPIYKDRKGFTACAEYIFDNLFGRVPGQAEGLLADSPNVQKIRFWSAFIYGVVPGAATSMVGEDGTRGSLIIQPRRDAVPAMLKYAGYDPDMVFLVSASPTHNRASAYGATDDDARGGVSATYDGTQIVHRYYHQIPGIGRDSQDRRGHDSGSRVRPCLLKL